MTDVIEDMPAVGTHPTTGHLGAASVIYVVGLYVGSFAVARLCRVIGTALCGVGHGGGGPLGEKLIVVSVCLYVVAFFAAGATIIHAWRVTRKRLPVIALFYAISFATLAELRDVSYIF